MFNQQTNILWGKANGLIRYLLAHSLSASLPLYIINEYPKSGGTWIGGMLSDVLGVPFPRNRLPMLRPSILHGHMIHSWNLRNLLLVWRDGRDVMISLYFHSVFENDRGNSRLVAQCRSDLGFADYSDVQTNLVPFMEYIFLRSCHPKMLWNDFVNRWAHDGQYVHVKYEDMRSNAVKELQRITLLLSGVPVDDARVHGIVEAHSFEKLSGRKVGTENSKSFMRKGIVGDWKNYFNPEARELFCHYAGHGLIKLGYEQSNHWVTTAGTQIK